MQQQAHEIQKVKYIQNSTYAEAARRVKQVVETRIPREQVQTSQANLSMKQLKKNDSTDSISKLILWRLVESRQNKTQP